MCPFCISTALGITAGTVTTGGVATLFAFTRRLAKNADTLARTPPEKVNHE